MNQYERVDKYCLGRILAIGYAIEKDIADNPYSLSNHLRNYTAKEKKIAASKLNKQSTKYYPQFSYQQNVLFKAVGILELLGYDQSALELAEVTRRLELHDGLFNITTKQVIDGAIKKHRSDAASGPRHHLHDEIIDVMKSTWEFYTFGSKTRMIKYVMEKYRVDEKTLKRWIKENSLGPLSKVENKNFSLVIPDRWKRGA